MLNYAEKATFVTLKHTLYIIYMSDKAVTLTEVQRQADEWIQTYGVRYFNELTNMAILTEEVGELARVMARTYGEQSFKEGEEPNLADEMADVL